MENKIISKIINDAIEFNNNDPKRINHLLKVYSFAKTIGELENIDAMTQMTLEIAAALHDIGIRVCEEKYHSTAGEYQEKEGPIVALDILNKYNIDKNMVDRVIFLIGHHHTYHNIDNIDYQILIEADFLVNIFEDGMERNAILNIKNKIFKTKSGINFLDNLFL